MGNSELKEQNQRLQKEIDELKPKEQALLDDNKKLKTKLNNLSQQIEQNRQNAIDLSPQDIHNLMLENAQIKDQISLLNNKVLLLQNYINNIEAEKYQLKSYCAQLQLNLQMRMMQMSYQQNLSNFNNFNSRANLYKNQINNLINQNKNKMNTNMNFQNNNSALITLIFNIDNKKKFPIVTLPEYKLGNVFLLLLDQIGDPNYYNIFNLKFFYMSQNITQNFLNNDDVRVLNLNSLNPTIDVCLSC